MLDRDAKHDLQRAALVIALALLVFAFGSCTASRAEAPGLVIVQDAAVVYDPQAALPLEVSASSEVEACVDGAGRIMSYDGMTRTLIVRRPCALRPMFRDGFE